MIVRTRTGRPVRATVPEPRLWDTYCSNCHLAIGEGDGARYPPLAHARWVTGDKARLIDIVLDGMQGPIDVEGTTYNGVMPGHRFLTDEEVAHLLTYIRRSFGNLARAVETAEVAERRAAPHR